MMADMRNLLLALVIKENAGKEKSLDHFSPTDTSR